VPVVTATVRPALKPLSIVTEPWTSFGSFDTRIFKDDFCHEKHFTAKVKATSVDGATINIKETANIVGEKGIDIKDELKLWFPIDYGTKHLHLRLKDKDSRIHYDNGVSELGGEKVNFYSSFGFARDFAKYNFKVGLATVFRDFNTDNRIKVDESQNVSWYHKTLFRKDDFRFGFIGVLDITNQLIAKKDVLLGYNYKEWDFILKGEQAFGHRITNWATAAQWFSNISLTALFNQSLNRKYAAQVEVDPSKGTYLGTALLEYKYSDKSFTKFALNTNAILSLVVKKTLNSTWSLSGGAELPIPGVAVAKDKEGRSVEPKPRFGIQVDINM